MQACGSMAMGGYGPIISGWFQRNQDRPSKTTTVWKGLEFESLTMPDTRAHCSKCQGPQLQLMGDDGGLRSIECGSCTI